MAADAPHPAFEAYAAEEVPQAAVGSPGKEGRLELAFAADADGRTRLVRDFARVPFHVSGSLDHDTLPDAAAVYVQSPTGGVAQGDRHEVTVEAGPEATALVSTQSATKVQRMERNYARASLSLTAGRGAHLEYLPDQTILHPDARYHQDVDVTLGADATVVLGDVVVPGRLARGERFDFERYYARVAARGPDGPLFEDTTHLRPADDDPRRAGVLGEFDVYGTLFVATTTDADAGALADRVHERVAATDARAGASTLPRGAGVAVRALGGRASEVDEALDAAWDEARTELTGAGAPDMRKY